MDYDEDKVDEMTLALLYLVTSERAEGGRAWKTFDMPTLGRLARQGWIERVSSRSATVDLTPEGMRRARALFRKHFQVPQA